MANVSSKILEGIFPFRRRKRIVQEIMQYILQFCKTRNAKTASIYVFYANCAGFPSFIRMN